MTKRKSQEPCSPTRRDYSKVHIEQVKDTKIYEAHSWKGGVIRVKVKGKPHRILSAIKNILYSRK